MDWHVSTWSFTPIPVVPEVQLTASPQAMLPGGSAMLNCSVIRANPRDYNFTWTRGDGPTTVKLSETGNTLILSPVTESDFGVYRCTVNNTAGKGIGTVVLHQASKCSHLALAQECMVMSFILQ